MPFQEDRFGHTPYRYTPNPKNDRMVERSPDKLPSASRTWYSDVGRDTRLFLEVRGLGCLQLHCTSGPDDGRFQFEGLSLFTKDEILFD